MPTIEKNVVGSTPRIFPAWLGERTVTVKRVRWKAATVMTPLTTGPVVALTTTVYEPPRFEITVTFKKPDPVILLELIDASKPLVGTMVKSTRSEERRVGKE